MKAKKKKKPVRKVKIVTTAADMVKKANVIVLKKKPAAGEVPPQVEKIVEVLEQKGGEMSEDELLPLVEQHIPDEHVPTLWEYWRPKLVSMGFLSVKSDEPVKSDERTDE
jgi:hypothetical protein